MANKGPAFGFSRDCQLKTIAKFDLERARSALQWIEDVTGEPLEPASLQIKNQIDIRDALRDGVALCRLMNILNPGAIKKINSSKIAFKQMENIEMFLRACRAYGMNEVDVFQTQDLYEAKSMYSAQKNGYKGPTIGVKIADENRREFSSEQIAEGKKVIGLQYGTNKVASQSGMTPYGATRKM